MRRRFSSLPACGIRIRFCLMGAFLLLFLESSPLVADSRQGPQAGSEEGTRGALLKSLLGENPLDANADDGAADQTQESSGKSGEEKAGEKPGNGSKNRRSEYAKTARQLLVELREAKQSLGEGHTGKTTQEAQKAAIAATERLLKLAKEAAASSSGLPASGSPHSGRNRGKSGQSQSQQGQGAKGSAAGTGGTGMTPGRRQVEGKATGSTDRGPGSGPPEQLYPSFRQTVIEHSWGHLPARMRQRLRNGGADQALPGYELLLNRYFQTLVRPEGASIEESAPRDTQ